MRTVQAACKRRDGKLGRRPLPGLSRRARASRDSNRAACAKSIALPGVATSLIAFVVVYFAVFGAGIVYMLRLMAHSPQPDEPDIEPGAPVRAAGITPAPALARASGRAGG